MRYLPVVLVALAAGCVGCGGLDPLPAFNGVRPAALPSEANVQRYISVDIAFIECPYGDHFLAEELWQRGDEHVDLDVQPVLEENGLRVCRVGGQLPARLQALLTSAKSCSPPRRIRADLDKATTILVGDKHPHLSIQYRDGDKARDVHLAQAQCLFEIMPVQGEEDELRIRFKSRLRHGRPLLETKVANDPGGSLHWKMEHGEPTEELPALTWELPVRPDEFVVVGTRLDRPGTYGQACFLSADKAHGKQTVLVLRASGIYGGAPPEPSDERTNQAPLAAQASLTARTDR